MRHLYSDSEALIVSNGDIEVTFVNIYPQHSRYHFLVPNTFRGTLRECLLVENIRVIKSIRFRNNFLLEYDSTTPVINAILEYMEKNMDEPTFISYYHYANYR
jgi:hypothetical protein